MFTPLLGLPNSSESDSILAIKYQESAKIYNEAKRLSRQGRLDKANQYFFESYHIRKKYFGENDKSVIYPLLMTANNYSSLGKEKEALETFFKARAIYEHVFGEDYPGIGIVLSDIGISYKNLGEIDKAISYYKQGIKLLRKDSARRAKQIIKIKGNYLFAELEKKNYEKVIQLCNGYFKEIPTYRHSFLYNSQARAYGYIGNHQKAALCFDKYIENIKQEKGNNIAILGIAYFNTANYYIDIKELNKGLKLLNEASKLFHKQYNNKHPKTSNLHSAYGDYHLRLSKTQTADSKKITTLKDALANYQKAAIAVTDSFESEDPYIHPPIEKCFDNLRFLSAIKQKAEVLNKLGDIYYKSDSINANKHYKLAFECYEMATKLIHSLRIGYLDRESKLFLAENEASTYQKTILTANHLYRHTKDDTYLHKSFEYTEKSKAATFLAAVRDIQAKAIYGIPDTLIVKEDDIKQELSYYKEQIFKEQQHAQPDTEKLSAWNGRILELSRAYEELTKFFAVEYPNYYEFKYLNKVVGINAIQQKIEDDNVIIEYMLSEPTAESEGELITFVISKDDFRVTTQEVDSTFIKHITFTQRFLKNSSIRKTKLNDFNQYCKSAFYLYEKLLSPHQEIIKSKHLTIVPDSKLAYFPFEALINTPYHSDNSMDFEKLNYLIKDYSFNYTYSATLLFDYFQPERKASKDLLAFAPKYSPNTSKSETRGSVWHQLFPLNGAKEEVNTISNIIDSDLFIDDEATEANFMKEAADYDILHLAMHTLVNDTLPMYSKLVFTNNKDSLTDNLLNTQEVYNMHFDARMAVLSACNTGSGKLQKGEGVMSLARGFLYAGCPSIVMTLWEVDDKSSANIMSNFYKNLKSGKTKDEALRMAKLSHLEQADAFKAHPYFWLSYVVVGDHSPLYSRSHYFWFILLGALLAGWLIFDVIRNRKGKKLHV